MSGFRTPSIASLGGLFAGLLLIVANRVTHTASRQPTPDTCQVTISGTEVLPQQVVWEAAFTQYATGAPLVPSLKIAPSQKQRVIGVAATALQRASALRQSLSASPAPGAGLDRAALIAGSILDARDELVRSLSQEEFSALDEQVNAASHDVTLTLPLAGRRKPLGRDNIVLCETQVWGRDYPYLVPEAFVWETYLGTWARASSGSISPTGLFNDSYVKMVQRSRLRTTSVFDIQAFLKIAELAAAEVADLRNAKTGDTQDTRTDTEVRKVVMRARYDLLRTLSQSGWRGVQQDVDRAVTGAKWWYRSRL